MINLAKRVKTGFWLEELAAPYYTFIDAGADVTLASPAGGQPPLDPKVMNLMRKPKLPNVLKQMKWPCRLLPIHKLSEVLNQDFDAVFYPGGHGPLWDLANDQNSISLIEQTLQANKPVALVCHAPGVLRDVKNAEGRPIVEGKSVTGFSNTEEDGVGLTDIVPF